MAQVVGLAAFIEGQIVSRRKLGENDCLMMVADWVLTATGHDPAADLRGRYRNWSQVMGLVEPFGSVAAMAADILDCRLVRTTAPREGDIALIASDQAENELLMMGRSVGLAIRFGQCWVVGARNGIVARDWPVLTAWRVG